MCVMYSGRERTGRDSDLGDRVRPCSLPLPVTQFPALASRGRHQPAIVVLSWGQVGRKQMDLEGEGGED